MLAHPAGWSGKCRFADGLDFWFPVVLEVAEGGPDDGIYVHRPLDLRGP
jgi:hypothetical protein